MYATNSLVDILGIPANELTGKSFYYCIQENCLGEAVKCLESAKANDSIAYLRFWFRDPRQNDRLNQDERMSDAHSSGDEDEAGGVHLSESIDHDGTENAIASESSNSMRSSVERDQTYIQNEPLDSNSRSSSGNSTDGQNHNDVIFDQPAGRPSRTSSVSTPEDSQVSGGSWAISASQIELEAVVSCTSDGLVVILRRAKPYIPHISAGPMHPYANGIFASPWASDPILPRMEDQWRQNPTPYLQQPFGGPGHPTAAQVNAAVTRGPATEDFMNSIREVAVFAWSLTGINGSLEQYARGTPTGESQPPSGLPIWDPNSNAGPEIPRNFDNYSEHSRNHQDPNGYSDQYQLNGNSSITYNNESRVVPYDQTTLQNGNGPVQYSSYNNCKQGNIPLNNIHRDQPQSGAPWANQPSQGREWDVPHSPTQLSNGLGNHYDIG